MAGGDGGAHSAQSSTISYQAIRAYMGRAAYWMITCTEGACAVLSGGSRATSFADQEVYYTVFLSSGSYFKATYKYLSTGRCHRRNMKL